MTSPKAIVPHELANRCKTITFNRKKPDANQLHKWHDDGYTVICPLCKSELVFQRSGIWCPQNPNHFQVHELIRTETRQQRREARKKKSIENMIKKGYTEEQIQEHLDKYYPELGEDR